MIPSRNWPLFAECAAPEAIEYQLKLARATARRHAREVERLTDLLAARNTQVAAGLWPPPKTDEEIDQ